MPHGSRIVRAKDEAGFLKALPKATHAIVWEFKTEWFALAPRLKALATPSAGKELLPTEGPKDVKIHFGHYHGDIIAESVAGFVLAWARGFFAVRHAPKALTVWPRAWLSEQCTEVAGTRAVIVGYGHVGRAIGRKLSALGVEVYGLTRHGVFHSSSPIPHPSSLFSSADWLILALPSTTGTDDFLNAALIRKLSRRCVIVNVGRGNAVDEKALATALKTHRIAGAYLDVRKHEQSGAELAFGANVAELAALPNCVLMPHSAAFSPRYVRQCFQELKDDGIL